jgi:signal recognition particle subunit SRP19
MDPSAFDPSPSLLDPSHIPSAAAIANAPQTGYISHTESEKYKGFQCLYPVYFDRTRSRAEGRRVGTEMAVPNPLARDIVDATQELGLRVVFEPGKMHPKDWANPGRVRVLIKVDGKAVNPRVKNSK